MRLISAGSLVRAQSGPLIRFAIPVLPAAEGRGACKIDRSTAQRPLRSYRCERRRLMPSAMRQVTDETHLLWQPVSKRPKRSRTRSIFLFYDWFHYKLPSTKVSRESHTLSDARLCA